MNRRFLWIIATFITISLITFPFLSFEFAYIPPETNVTNKLDQDFSLLSNETNQTEEQLARLGRKLFYQETFGNEIFFTDIMGVFNGALTIPSIAKAILKLKREGTSNLKVKAVKNVEIGDIQIKKGDMIETGLDVAKGSLTPLGIKVVLDQGKLKAGLSCAVCHSSTDTRGNVVEGVPNSDLNAGLMLALGTNTAAYFTHAKIDHLQDFTKENADRNIHKSIPYLPDAEALEKKVDEAFSKWPKGSNSTTINFANNPVQIPDVFTKGDHPYGWSGQGLIGPFNGLVAAINNAHGQNTDSLTQAEASRDVLHIPKETYLATILQNAANKTYRYDPESNEKPSDFFSRVDPTPNAPGVNEVIKTPTFPKASYLSTTGVFSSSPGFRAWEQNIALAAYMNSLKAPPARKQIAKETYDLGQKTFARAGCSSCHAGANYTNNKVIPIGEIGTDPSRAHALSITEKGFQPPIMYDPNTPVPLPPAPKMIQLKMTDYEQKQLALAWGQNGTAGGYKVPSLLGLAWSAPYLHDGGVAAGQDEQTDLGITGTFLSGVKPDPYFSLKVLVDKKLRQKVIEANKDPKVPEHVQGIGHNYWVDETTSFTKKEQDALIQYLLHLK